MKLASSKIEIARAIADSASVERIEVGPIRIGGLAAQNASGRLGVDAITITGAQLSIAVQATASFGADIPLDLKSFTTSRSTTFWVPNERRSYTCKFTDGPSGSLSLEAKPLPAPGEPPFGDAPSLFKISRDEESLSLSLSMSDIDLGSIAVEPSAGVAAAGASLTGHTLTNASVDHLPIPAAGVGFDRLTAADLHAPAVALDEWRIDRAAATIEGGFSRDDAVVTLVDDGTLRFKNVHAALETAAFDIPGSFEVGVPGASKTVGPVTVSLPGFKLSVGMHLAVTAALDIQEITLSGVNLAGTFAHLEVTKIAIPVNLLTLVLQKLHLYDVRVPGLEVSP